MTGISRYEKTALLATAVFLALCLILLAGLGRGEDEYTISAAPAGTFNVESGDDGYPDSLLPGEKININTAPVRDLQRLPGIGEKRAQDIVARREERGSFASVEELTGIPGIGEGILAGIRDYITISEG